MPTDSGVLGEGVKVARLVGGAGTGKTHRLMETLDRVIATGVEPHEVGFVTFTRAAREEAVSRACDRFMIPPTVLERKGWFRTLHSVCHRLLRVAEGQLLIDNAESRRWISEAVGEAVGGVGGSLDEASPYEPKTRAEKVLAMWDSFRASVCRCTLKELQVHRRDVDYEFPAYAECAEIITQYETAKARDERLDFTDLLARVAGLRFTTEGAEHVEPEGDTPSLVAWFHDEMQDSSPLADAVFRRLIAGPRTKWVYLAGDPFQSIYLFAGADPACFMGLPVDKQEIMKQSHRCGAKILALGERILSACSDYWDRGIKPAPHAGEIDRRSVESLHAEVDPREDWLVLGRTNRIVREAASRLDEAGIPWVPTSGKGGWAPTIKTTAINTLSAIERGEPIKPEDWVAVVKTIPAAGRLVRGTKAHWLELQGMDEIRKMPPCQADEYTMLGLTEEYLGKIRAGAWVEDIPGSERYLGAVSRFGKSVVDRPRVRLGTIHSVKGAEADNVALLTATSGVIQRGMSDPREYDAEQRVWYVGVTRARRKLLLFDQAGSQHKKGLPA